VHHSKSGPLLRISDDTFVPGLAKLARRIHDTSGSKVVPQIIHFLKVAKSGWRQTVDMLSLEDIDRIVDEFGNAVARARESGFDGAELHSAHAYTLASFLSRTNKRQDEYGGQTLEGRLRRMWSWGLTGEEVDVAGFFRAGLTRKDCSEGRFALSKAVEGGSDIVGRLEMVHAISAAAKFPGRLWAAQQEHAHDRTFPAVQVKDLGQAVLVLGDAAVSAAGGTGETLFLQCRKGLADHAFVEGHDWIAIVLLVAGVDQGIQGKRIVVRGGDVFFDQRAEDARFDFSEDESHGVDFQRESGLILSRAAGEVSVPRKVKIPILTAKDAAGWGTL